MDIASLSAISGIENISKYADNSLSNKIISAFDSIPVQLAWTGTDSCTYSWSQRQAFI